MGQLERISVEVSGEAADALREAVASGEFASAEEAARAAIEGWRFWREDARGAVGLSDEELGRLWDEGLASGEPVDGEEAMARVRARLESFIAERHGPGA